MRVTPHDRPRVGRPVSAGAGSGAIAGLIGGLLGTVVMDQFGAGLFVAMSAPATLSFAVIGDAAARFCAMLGVTIAGGAPLGALLHYLIGLGLGGIFGAAVSQLAPLRALSTWKGVGLSVLYVEVMSQPLLVAAALLLHMTAAEAAQWFGISFVMHLVYGLVLGLIVYRYRERGAALEITVLARGQRFAELRARGIVLEDALSGQRTTTQVAVIERLEPDDAYDLVVVLLQKQQVAAILPALAASRRTPNVLFMTNNAAGPAAYIAALGRERVLLGFPGAGGVRAGCAMRVYVAPRGTQPTTIGELDGAITPRLRELAARFGRAGFPVALSRHMDAWLRTHVALVSPIANALYLAGGDTYRLARTRDGLALLVRAIREGLEVLHALDVPITPAKYRLLARLPEPLLVALLRRGLASERAAVALAGHANAARDEMAALTEEFRALIDQASVPTPAIDRLAAYRDPAWPIFYIDPDACIDCGACVPACPADAIFSEDEVPATYTDDIAPNRRFFAEGPGYWAFDLDQERVQVRTT